MSTPKKTMASGLTGFWMRVGRDGNVRVVNGTMYKLLNAKSVSIHILISSQRFRLQLLRAKLYAKRCNRRADNQKSSFPRTYGAIGLQRYYAHRDWANSTILRKWKALRAHPDTSQNIYLNRPFSRLIGLKDGSAFDTVKIFQSRKIKKVRR